MKNKYTPVITFILKLILGITFIAAGYPKIADPAAFARILYGYAIFPAATINVLAIILPFIEVTAGLGLIMRFFSRSALIIINALLSLFILLISFNLIRGHEFDCGCFSVAEKDSVESAVMLLVRDVLLLAAGLFVLKQTPEKKRAIR